MKLHAIFIFAVVLTPALLLDSTSAQCDLFAIGGWIVTNLTPQCQGQMLTFNTVPTQQTMSQWRNAVNYVCTTDSCGGALYRYLLANCNSLESNTTGRVRNISLAVALQNRCSNGTSTGDRCYCGESVSAVIATIDNSLICMRSLSLDALAACAPLQQNPNMTCPEACRTALQNLGGYLDCCFNSIYNTSESPLSGVLMGAENPGLWFLCQVPTPDGRCPNVLSDTALPTTATVTPTTTTVTPITTIVTPTTTTVTPTTTTVTPTTACGDATAASKAVIGLLLALALIKALF